MTLNKFSKVTGMLNPAIKAPTYMTIASMILREIPADQPVSVDTCLSRFAQELEKLGSRGTTESFTEYLGAQIAVRKAIPPAAAKNARVNAA